MAATLNSLRKPPVAASAAQRNLRGWLWGLVAIASLVMLTACSTRSSAATAVSSDPRTRASKLALGTLHLESTDQAVDAATAAQLLPLWQLMDELSTNSAASPAEITAVIGQIESTMTSSQLKSIQALNLTDSSVAQASQGGTSASSGSTTTASNVKASSAAGPVPGADMGLAGMPLDGGGGMAGAASQQSSSSATTAGASGNTALFEELIQLLERKLQD